MIDKFTQPWTLLELIEGGNFYYFHTNTRGALRFDLKLEHHIMHHIKVLIC